MENIRNNIPSWTLQVKTMEMHAKLERDSGNMEKAISILACASIIAKTNHAYSHSRNLIFRCAKYYGIFGNQLFKSGKIHESADAYKMEISMLIEAQKDVSARDTILRTITKFINGGLQSPHNEGFKNKAFSMYLEALSMAVKYKMLGYAERLCCTLSDMYYDGADSSLNVKIWGEIGSIAKSISNDLELRGDPKISARWYELARFAYCKAENFNTSEYMNTMREIMAHIFRN